MEKLWKNLKILIDFWATYYYNILTGCKREVMYMPEKKKIGRPTNNPKSNPIHVRLDDKSLEILDKYCKQENIKRTEGIRQGIQFLESRIK